jgi:lipid II:glycine glycyltransferase (peptidoglycan interpeptide bridge formation enzyme)
LLTSIAEDRDTRPTVVRTHATLPEWFSRQVGTVQVIDLSNGMEGALSGARRKTRQNVKLAQKAGLIARPITSRSEFLGPSLSLTARSRRRLGAPTQPRRYWSRLWELHEQGEALTIAVYLGPKVVANGLFMIGSKHAVFKYSASEVGTRDLRTNYLTLATALDHIAARGVQSIDLGITDIHNVSLREYKTKWGGEERPAHFSATDARLLPDTLEPGALLTGTIQHTPVFVGRAIGSLAYPFAA